MLKRKLRKPIMQVEGNVTYNYKYCHKAYALTVELVCFTDLNEKQFENFLDGRYTRQQIERFEIYGMF